MSTRTTWEILTPLHVCSIEGFPGRLDVFVAGLYELKEEEASRLGGIGLYATSTGACLDLIERGGGVLDLKTTPRLEVAAVYSTGVLEVVVLDSAANKLMPLASIEDETKKEGLFLSVDWHPSGAQLAVSTQAGSILLFALKNGVLEPLGLVPSAHVLFGEAIPAWIVAWDASGTRLLSGGDDCALRLWDASAPGGPLPLASACKTYSAGVTSGAWHPAEAKCGNVLAVGSYDESVRVWDARALQRPFAEAQTGGGVWRTKWVPSRPGAGPGGDGGADDDGWMLALACMHGGSTVLRVDDLASSATSSSSSCSLRSIASHTDAASSKHLAYGIHAVGPGPHLDVLSCSFYDNKIFRWTSSF